MSRFAQDRLIKTLTCQSFAICQRLAGIESETSLYAALDDIVADVVSCCELDAVALVMRKPNQRDFTSHLHDLHAHGLKPEERKRLSFFMAQAIVPELMGRGQIVSRDDVRVEIMGNQAEGQRSKMVSMLAVPMRIKGEVVGILMAFRSEIGAFCPDDGPFLQRIASLIAEDIENSSAFLKVAKDEATGFYSRRVVFEVLIHETARARRYQAPLSAIILEAEAHLPPNDDNSKTLEAFLKRFSQRVMAETRQSDIVARISDSAFLFLQPMTTRESAVEFAQRICTHFSENPLILNESIVPLKMSAGVSSLKGDDDDGMTLLKRADGALDVARKNGQRVVAHS